MGNYQSKYVHEIGWYIVTSEERASGTDSPVTVTILRDDSPIIALNVEPGNTPRLDRGESAFYSWRFTGTYFTDDEFVTWIAGLPYPDAVEFPDDVQGHLKCRFRIWGDDLWQKDEIVGYVRYVTYHHIPGTIDSFEWVPDLNWTQVGVFSRDVILSTNDSELTTTWTLVY
jgi:hypothetical protein